MKRHTENDKMTAFSKEEIENALAYIHDELEAAFPSEDVEAQIAAAKLAAVKIAPPDTTKFKAEILEYMKSRESIIDFPPGLSPSEEVAVAIAAREKRKPTKHGLTKKKDGGDASSGS